MTGIAPRAEAVAPGRRWLTLCLGILLLAAAPALATPPSSPGSQVGLGPGAARGGGTPVAGITPGLSSRAEVELLLGAPIEAGSDSRLTYRAPASLPGASALRVEFEDGRTVAVVEVALQPAIDPQAIVPSLGQLVSSEQIAGHQVSYFYPSIMGVVQGDDRRIVAVLYLAPRRLADRFCSQSLQLLANGDSAAASTECDKAVAVAPTYARGYFCRGNALTVRGRDDDAMREYLAATEAPMGEDWRAQAWLQLVQPFLQRGWNDRARDAIDEAKRIDPDSSAAYTVEIELLRASGQTQQALDLASEAISRFSGDPALALTLGDLLHDLGRSGAAADAYELALVRGAGDPATLLLRIAQGRLEQGDRATARERFRQAVTTSPDRFDVQRQAAEGLLALGQPAEAIAHFQTAARMSPADLTSRRGVAACMLSLGRVDAAWSALYELYQEHPADALTLAHLARAKAAQQEEKEAFQWLERAVRAGFEDAKFARTDPHLAWLYREDRGKFDRLLGTPWGAVAAGPGAQAISWGHGSRALAEHDALRECARGSGVRCELVRAFTACAAFATGSGGLFASAVGNSLGDARKEAEKACRAQRRGAQCSVVASACAAGSR